MARAAGSYAQIAGRDQGYAILRLNSGEQRLVSGACMATIGAVSNPDHSNISIGKAGRNRWLGWRPRVRGVAMNPVDHPHGGGEGRTSGGRHPVTPVGQADQGQEDPQQQVDDEIHPALAARPQERSLGKDQEKDVARSVWKGPFFDGYLLKKVEKTRESGRNEVIKIWSRRSTVLPQFVGAHLRRLQRPQAHPGARVGGHDRPQVRRVRSDADLLRPRGRPQGEEGIDDGQGQARARR